MSQLFDKVNLLAYNDKRWLNLLKDELLSERD